MQIEKMKSWIVVHHFGSRFSSCDRMKVELLNKYVLLESPFFMWLLRCHDFSCVSIIVSR